jgi:phage shock protein A
MRIPIVGRAGVVAIVAMLALAGCKDRALEAVAMQCEAHLKSEQEQRKRLEVQVKEQQAKIERLLADLTSAKDEAQRAAIQKQLDEAVKNAKGGASPAKSPACNCQPADPLCSCR